MPVKCCHQKKQCPIVGIAVIAGSLSVTDLQFLTNLEK